MKMEGLLLGGHVRIMIWMCSQHWSPSSFLLLKLLYPYLLFPSTSPSSIFLFCSVPLTVMAKWPSSCSCLKMWSILFPVPVPVPRTCSCSSTCPCLSCLVTCLVFRPPLDLARGISSFHCLNSAPCVMKWIIKSELLSSGTILAPWSFLGPQESPNPPSQYPKLKS